MSETIEHPVFGTLRVEREDDRLVFQGEAVSEDGRTWPVLISGIPEQGEDAILSTAAQSHATFAAKELEFRTFATTEAIDDNYLEEIMADAEEFDEEEEGGGLSRESLPAKFREILGIRYFTEEDTVSVTFEDEGYFGVDLSFEASLDYSRKSASMGV